LTVQESRAIAGRTRCCSKFRYVSIFASARCRFSATARLSCIHQWLFRCWNYTQYADFHGRDAKPKIATRTSRGKTISVNVHVQI